MMIVRLTYLSALCCSTGEINSVQRDNGQEDGAAPDPSVQLHDCRRWGNPAFCHACFMQSTNVRLLILEGGRRTEYPVNFWWRYCCRKYRVTCRTSIHVCSYAKVHDSHLTIVHSVSQFQTKFWSSYTSDVLLKICLILKDLCLTAWKR